MPRLVFAYVRSALLAAMLLAAWMLRNHLFVLGEVAYTYAAFQFRHQSLLDYPPLPSDQSLRDAPPIAPAIFHHIYLDEACDPEKDHSSCAIKPRYLANIETCRALHPEWTFNLWTARNATDFVARNYPKILPSYTSYRQTIQRANILRYLLLAHHGGVYLDLDVSCRAPLDELRTLSWITPPAHPAGINNAFILSAAQHPFLTDALIPRIVPHDMHWPLPYVENMLSTGCMFISSMVARFGSPDMKVLGGGAKHMLRGHVVTPLFEHGGESSWHRWDAEMFLTIGKNIWLLVVGVAALAAVGLCLVMYRTLSGRRRRRSRTNLDFEESEELKHV